MLCDVSTSRRLLMVVTVINMISHQGDDEKDDDTDFYGDVWVFATGAAGGVC